MSDTAELDNEPTEDNQLEVAEQPTGEQVEPGDSPEEQAARMGWKPEEEYNAKHEGKDLNWVNAETFLDNTENDPVQLRKSLKVIERNYQKNEKTLNAILDHQEREVEQARKKAIDETNAANEAALAQAVEDGDTEAASKIYKARQTPEESAEDPRVVTWLKENEYMQNDPIMSDKANQYADLCANQGDNVETMLKKTDVYMRKHFPTEFPEVRQAPGRVNGGNRNNVNIKTKHEPGTYQALNQESKTACDRAVKEWQQRNPTWKTEDCVAQYLSCATEEMFQ